jgi:DNA-binding transcriptional LysR family regulator
MDLRQLRQFVAVAEELHFGRAAERLHMTQPPLSQAIQALERELGAPLFVRTRRSVALSPVGAQLLPEVREILAAAAALPDTARRLARGQAGRLSLAFVSTADYSLLPDLVRRYKAANPTVALALQEATSDWQVEALLQRRIDAGLVIALQGALHPALAYRPLLREPLVAAVPEVSGFGLKARLHDLAREPLILFPRHGAPAFHDLITGWFAQGGCEPRFGQEAIQMQTIVSLVSAGLGVALVPRSLRAFGRAGVRYLDLHGEPPVIETGLLWRRAAPSPALQRLLEIIEPRGPAEAGGRPARR